GRAVQCQRLFMTAVVTTERLRRPMHCERHRAAGALAYAAALGALEKRRPPPTVEQEQRLLLPGQCLGDCLVEPVGPWYRARARDPWCPAEIDQLDRWQRPRADPLWKPYETEFPFGGEPHAFERGGRAAQHEGRVLQPGAHSGHRCGVIPGRLAVLVGGLVLLVHHDDAEIGHRGEDRRPRSDRYPPLAPAEQPPRVGALAI